MLKDKHQLRFLFKYEMNYAYIPTSPRFLTLSCIKHRGCVFLRRQRSFYPFEDVKRLASALLRPLSNNLANMSEKKQTVDLGLLEEDDEFEEFPAEGK